MLMKRSGENRTRDASDARTLVAILAVCSVMMTNAAIMPLLGEISRAFPDESVSAVQTVYTLTTLAQLPFMLLSGNLTGRFSKKGLSMAGLALVAAGGGVLPLFLHGSLAELYVAAFLIGAGSGICNIMSSALISDHYQGVDKGRVMGYQSAALSTVGGVMSFASGLVAVRFAWWASFALYLLVIPLLALVARFLPSDRPVVFEKGEARASYSGKVILWATLAFFFGLFMYSFMNNIALYLESLQLGGADAAGFVSTLFMLVGIPAGLVMGAVLKRLKRHTVWVNCALVAAGVLLLACARDLAMVYAAALVFGIGYALRNPSVVTFTAYLAPGNSAAAAIALVQSCGTACGFVSPFVVNAIRGAVGGDYRTTFLACGVALAALTVCYALLNPVTNEDIAD